MATYTSTHILFVILVFGKTYCSPHEGDSTDDRHKSTCDPSAKFRTFNGTCNNLEHPLWGSANSCFQRLLPACYTGESGFRESVRGGSLPLPEDIARSIERKIDKYNDPTNQMPIYFSQFLTHDISHTRPDCEIETCPSSSVLQAPMVTEKTWKPFIRSAACPTCSTGNRVQINTVTSFIDGSVLYGNSEAEARNLRTNDGTGKMKLKNSHFGRFMPKHFQEDEYCLSDYEFCFTGGDPRVNQHAMLSSLQTVFIRDHNRIAETLKILNPHWHKERIFQESRRIIGAKLQVITYKEYLPLIMRNEAITRSHLRVGNLTKYDPKKNPSIISEFSSATSRVAHSRLWANGSTCRVSSPTHKRLAMDHLYPFTIIKGYMDPLLKIVTYATPSGCDQNSLDDYLSYTYPLPGIPSRKDLTVVDIMRGRDHGLSSYVTVVEYCFNLDKRIRRFSDLHQFIPPEKIKILKRIYKSVRDIDIVAGVLSEQTIEGVVLSPTAECLQEIHLRNLKFGDRYYFEHEGEAGSFTREQIEELRKVTLAKIICDNSNLKYILPLCMQRKKESNPLVKCADIEDMNLTRWQTEN